MAGNGQQHRQQMGWGRFAGMIATSTAVMFMLMYQLVYAFGHVHFSLNRFVASLVMACVMTVIMLTFMWPMYRQAGIKIAVLALAIIFGALLLYVNRSQALIGDAAFMQSMIPHHSIAINNARKADISDPRVRRLADQIIEAQVKEIRAMDLLLDDLKHQSVNDGPSLPARPAELTPEMEAEARGFLQ